MDEQDRINQLSNLMLMAQADGKLSAEELHMLTERARLWGIDGEDFDRAVQYVLSPGATFSVPHESAEREQMLRELARMMAIDGKLAATERQLFGIAAKRMGIEPAARDKLMHEVLRAQTG